MKYLEIERLRAFSVIFVLLGHMTIAPAIPMVLKHGYTGVINTVYPQLCWGDS